MQKNFGGLFLDASATWSNFLRNVYVDGYFTPQAGIGIKFNAHAGLRLGYSGNFGTNYNTNGGNVLLYLTD